MRTRFVRFLQLSCWTSVLVALAYHVRFLLFVDYEDVHAKTGLSRVFYFLTGLGHESFAVFFVLDGILAGRALLRPGDAGAAAIGRRAGALYRLLLPGLILGAACDAAGARFFNGSGLYTAYPAFSTLTLGVPALLGNLFMLQPFAVPTYGSNGMLYLLSFLFWAHVLLGVFLHAARAGKAVLACAVVLLAPPQFLVWAAIWLTGIAAAHAGAARTARPPLPVVIAAFAGTLLLSRIVGADTQWLPPPFGAWLVDCKYVLVGASFAVLAWAVSPARARHETAPGSPAAAFAFFFHFPVMMLLVGSGATLFRQPLMQQPAPARYGVFVAVVTASVGAAVLVIRAAAGAIDAVTGRRAGAAA